MKKILFALVTFISLTSQAQQPWSLGIDYNYNPNEQNASLRYDNFQNKGSFNLGLSYNFGMAGDKGFGISAGYRYNFTNSLNSSLFTGVKLSLLWGHETNAKNEEAKTMSFRPAIEGGYQAVISNHYLIVPGISYGYGFDLSDNVNPSSYEGGRLFGGVGIGYRF